MKQENGYWEDDNGNIWPVKAYTEVEAQAKSDTLVNCQFCYDIEHCSNCYNCSECFNCEWCYNCCSCKDCRFCFKSKDCRACDDCYKCAKCENCFGCCLCVDCVNCDYCEKCTSCEKCERCFSRNSHTDKIINSYVSGDKVKFNQKVATYVGTYESKHVIVYKGRLMFVEEDQITRI